MWVAVLLVLLITGAIFYGLATFYTNLLQYQNNRRYEDATDKKQDDEYDGNKHFNIYIGTYIGDILKRSETDEHVGMMMVW